MVIFRVQIGGWAFIRAWAFIRDFMVYWFRGPLPVGLSKFKNKVKRQPYAPVDIFLGKSLWSDVFLVVDVL